MDKITDALEWAGEATSNLFSHPYAVIETATDVEHDRYRTYEAAAWDCRFGDMHVEYPGPVGRIVRPIWRRIRGRNN